VGVVRQVPTAAGETDIHLRAVDGDSGKIAVSPWPFAAARVPVACEGILLPSGCFNDAGEMQINLSNAGRLSVSAELMPAH
jgi:hypothetical protein